MLENQLAKMVTTLSIFVLLLVLASGCLPVRPSDPLPNLPTEASSSPSLLQTANTLVSIGTTGGPVPANFLGLSAEMSMVCEIIQLDAQHPAYYEQLYRNFGAGTLHIGGHTSDLSQWVPDGKASCSQRGPIVTKSLVKAFFAFAHRIGWKVTWGLNLIANNPKMAASEAVYVAAVGGTDLTAFTIGNEPELYTSRNFRPRAWSPDDYFAEWQRTRDAVLAAVPSARFIGPEVCCESTIFAAFIRNSRGDNSLLAISRHYYRFDLGPPPNVTGLLTAEGSVKFAEAEAGWVKFANSYLLPFEITEANSISDAGTPGQSNTLAAALWMSDLLLQSATAGVQQMDIHNAPNAAYNVISNEGTPTAPYYALLLAHTATLRARIVQVALQTALNLTAYAFSDSLGNLRVVLINKETTQSARVTINTGHLYLSASLFRLTGPDLSATSHVTLGARTLSAQGTWTPQLTSSNLHGTLVQIPIPASSAVCITFQA